MVASEESDEEDEAAANIAEAKIVCLECYGVTVVKGPDVWKGLRCAKCGRRLRRARRK